MSQFHHHCATTNCVMWIRVRGARRCSKQRNCAQVPKPNDDEQCQQTTGFTHTLAHMHAYAHSHTLSHFIYASTTTSAHNKRNDAQIHLFARVLGPNFTKSATISVKRRRWPHLFGRLLCNWFNFGAQLCNAVRVVVLICATHTKMHTGSTLAHTRPGVRARLIDVRYADEVKKDTRFAGSRWRRFDDDDDDEIRWKSGSSFGMHSTEKPRWIIHARREKKKPLCVRSHVHTCVYAEAVRDVDVCRSRQLGWKCVLATKRCSREDGHFWTEANSCAAEFHCRTRSATRAWAPCLWSSHEACYNKRDREETEY